MAKLNPFFGPETAGQRAAILNRFVNEDYLTSIGRVITQWSLMESMLDACIWKTAGLRNDYGRIFAAQQQVASKLDTLNALLTQRKPVLAEQFSAVADYVRECLQGMRNTVAHGMWSSTDDGTFVVKFTARGKLVEQGRSPMPKEDLDQLSLNIAGVTDWLMQLSDYLPKSRLRPGGLGHKTPDAQNRLGCATRKSRALQPPTLSRKVLADRAVIAAGAKPQKPRKLSQRQKRDARNSK